MVQISVCMASYNGGLFIAQQLKSILNQLTANDEIVISDDGSTDDTIHIIQYLEDPRIKLYFNTQRHGPIGNFENALRHSSGQLIILSDQDDIWLPNKVEVIKTLLIEYDLILTNCEVINQQGIVLHPSFFELRGSRQGFWQNLYRNSYIGCCMAFRRTVLDYALPFPKQIHMHDWWIGLMVELKGRVIFYDDPLIKYVRHGKNASPTGEKGFRLDKRLSNRFFLLWNVAKRLFA